MPSKILTARRERDLLARTYHSASTRARWIRKGAYCMHRYTKVWFLEAVNESKGAMMPETISIRDISAGPGEKVYGRVKVGEWIDGSDIGLSLVIVNGAKPGPCFAAFAAFHGDEVVGTAAIHKLAGELDPSQMSGSFIGVLGANPVAFIMGTRQNTLEHGAGSNDMKPMLDRAKDTGSLSERVTAMIRDEVVVPHLDYWVDIHSSAIGSNNYPRAICAGEHVELPTDLREKINSMIEATNFEFIFRARGTDYKGIYFTPSHVLEQVFGKPGLVLETGYAPSDEGAGIIHDAMENILKSIGVVPGSAERTNSLTFFNQLVAVRANRGGLWEPTLTFPSEVKKDDLIGRIHALDGTVAEEVRAPVDGVIVKTASTAAISTGVRAHVIGIRAD
jgi:predicted deacylase